MNMPTDVPQQHGDGVTMDIPRTTDTIMKEWLTKGAVPDPLTDLERDTALTDLAQQFQDAREVACYCLLVMMALSLDRTLDAQSYIENLIGPNIHQQIPRGSLTDAQLETFEGLLNHFMHFEIVQ